MPDTLKSKTKAHIDGLRIVSPMCLLLLLPPYATLAGGELQARSATMRCFCTPAVAAKPTAARGTRSQQHINRHRNTRMVTSDDNIKCDNRKKNLYHIYAHGVADDELYGQRTGASYGNYYGPSPGHTWAAEAVILSQLRQVFGSGTRTS